MPTTFELQFNPEEIYGLIHRNAQQNQGENTARKAGLNIAKKDYSRDNFDIICKWKTGGRGKSRLVKNTKKEIEDALSLAANAKTERAAIAVLLGLQGVHVPVASAVLTMIKPRKYTILDYRALEALGSNTKDRSINFYLEYLKACRRLAGEHHISLRDLDHALWQWSKERSDN